MIKYTYFEYNALKAPAILRFCCWYDNGRENVKLTMVVIVKESLSSHFSIIILRVQYV